MSSQVLCGSLNANSPQAYLDKEAEVTKGTLEATPNIIIIKNERSFNIDRKTLVGGWGTERSFSCKLLEVDTSQNLL